MVVTLVDSHECVALTWTGRWWCCYMLSYTADAIVSAIAGAIIAGMGSRRGRADGTSGTTTVYTAKSTTWYR